MTREAWLQAAVALIAPRLVAKCGRELPTLTVTVGWPSSGGLSRTRQVLGQCWDGEASADGSHAIFISPVLDAAGPSGALAALVHEMVHALVGVDCKHKGPFATACRQVGLEGKPTATVAGTELLTFLDGVAAKLGDYPHAKLTPQPKPKKDTTRMIKCECAACGYVCRATRKWLDEVGAPICPCRVESGELTPMFFDPPEGPPETRSLHDEPGKGVDSTPTTQAHEELDEIVPVCVVCGAFAIVTRQRRWYCDEHSRP